MFPRTCPAVELWEEQVSISNVVNQVELTAHDDADEREANHRQDHQNREFDAFPDAIASPSPHTFLVVAHIQRIHLLDHHQLQYLRYCEENHMRPERFEMTAECRQGECINHDAGDGAQRIVELDTFQLRDHWEFVTKPSETQFI
jgi:hypothetical protein